MRKNSSSSSRQVIILTAGWLLTALALSWISNGNPLESLWSFFIVLAAGSGIIALVFRGLRPERLPGWLLPLTISAAFLRILAGALWFALLPAAGYETEVQQAGYIMEDAYQRDTAAWQLAASDQSLFTAFDGTYRIADQYGGLLFLSASVYRVLSPGEHQPLLIVVLAAAASAAAVPIAFAFTRRIFDERTAKWAAWLPALFPEAVLLGSVQMREAWIMPLAAAAFYGLARYATREESGTVHGLGWILGALLLLVPLSPPFAVILIGLLAVFAVALFRWAFLRNWRFWAVLGGILVLVFAVIWLAWPQIAPRLNAPTADNPLELVWTWLGRVAHWQAYLSERSSGWLQKIFDETPDWFDLPFLIGYGVTRPLLPAQLVASTIPFWWWVGVWRALGWTLMLALLLYAPVQLLTHKGYRGIRTGLVLIVWFGILYASFWGGGDQWDNPRYRVAFIALQAALSAAVVVLQRRQPHPALRRTLMLAGSVTFWLILWYLQRYTDIEKIFGWIFSDLFLTLAAGLATGILLIIGDVIRTRRRLNRSPQP